MQARRALRAIFEAALSDFLTSRPMQRIATGDFSVKHYQAVLREIYFYTREDPQLQAWATAWFKGDDRSLVRGFLKHALAEVGHDEMALSDLRTLGLDTTAIPSGFPLATTVALTAFPYWAVQFLNPVSYIGYLYFLEGLPTSAGATLKASLQKVGVPGSAMTFLEEHSTVDLAHIKLMDRYVDTLVRSERDLTDVSYAITTTAKLYALMIEGAFEAVENSIDVGARSFGEIDRTRPGETAVAA